jgi:subtilisin family serine protease
MAKTRRQTRTDRIKLGSLDLHVTLRRVFLVAAATAVVLAVVLIGTQEGHAGTPPPTTILVKFHAGVDGPSAVEKKGDAPAATTKTKVVVVALKPGETTAQALGDYRSDPGVAYAEPNAIYTSALAQPNDPSFPSQWALSRIQALSGWTTYPGTYSPAGGAPVAVVDSGIDATSPDLSDGRVLTGSGANCLSGTCVSDPGTDESGHGTSVAGVIDAAPNNAVGIAGVAYSSPVIPVKVLDSSNNGTAASIASGIMWAADHGARVVNLSLAGPYSQTICDAVAYAVSAGAVVVAAAGNQGWATPTYPAACPGAIGIAATDANDNVPYWSNSGSPNVFLSAPGVSILTTARGGGYTTVDGTSLAAPYASGLAALLFSQDPLRTPNVVKSILAQTADKVGTASYGSDPYSTCATCTWNASYGYGRIDVAGSLSFSGSTASLPDFSLSGPAQATVGQGKSTTVALSVAAFAGYSGSVGLSVTGLPSGATASFSPASVAAPGSSQLTVTAASTTPAGTYPLTISGAAGASTHTTSVTLSVVAPDFSVSSTQPTVSVPKGSSAVYSLSLASAGGFSGTASLAVSGAPSNTTASLSASSAAVPGSSTLTVKTSTSTTAGSYTLTIKATSGSLVRTATVTLNVVVPDFTVSASPTSATVNAGQTATYPVSVGFVNGFTGTISLTASYPSGATVGYSPSSLSAAGSSTLTVKTATTTAGGTYTLTITGTSSTKVVHTTTVTLTVIAPDFAVSSSADSATILQGQSATYPIAVDALNGFSGSIALTVSGYPSGATPTFSTSSVTAPGGSTLTVKTTGTIAIGTYTLTVTGTSASKATHTAKLTLVINPTGDFTMSSTSSTITVKRGSSYSPSLSLSALNGFYSYVAFSTSGLPTGMSATWTKTSLLVSGTTAVTNSVKLAAASSTTAGTYTVTLVGTAGSTVHTVVLTVVVS